MKIQNSNLNIRQTPAFNGAGGLQKKFAESMSKFDQLGEAANISFDFLGKAVVVPIVIMAASNEPKEKKEYSALKNPVAATIQLILEVPVLYFGSMFIGKLGNQGKLDKEGNNFSYNAKLAQDNFVKTLKETVKDEDTVKDITEKLDKKGLTKKLSNDIEDVVKNTNSDALKTGFEGFQTAHKRLYHLQNRICFAAALLLTPALCALENWAHPKVMNAITNKENKTKKITQPAPNIAFNDFHKNVKGGQ